MTTPEKNESLGLERELRELRLRIEKVNSIHHRLLLGVLGGIGTALGAAIIAAVVLPLFNEIITNYGWGERTILISESATTEFNDGL